MGDKHTGKRKRTRKHKRRCRYSIEDVLLPLPGQQTVFPANQVGSLFRQFLSYDGMDAQFLSACSIEKCFSEWQWSDNNADGNQYWGSAYRYHAHDDEEKQGQEQEQEQEQGQGQGQGQGQAHEYQHEYDEEAEGQEEEQDAKGTGSETATGQGKSQTVELLGAYRPLLVIPSQFEWQQIFYDTPGADLNPDPILNPEMPERVACKIADTRASEADLLYCGQTVTAVKGSAAGGRSEDRGMEEKGKKGKKDKARKKKKKKAVVDRSRRAEAVARTQGLQQQQQQQQHPFTALRMSFCLPSGSYATMLIREIIKPDHADGRVE
eukprot:g1134.t1